jgi:hypothetical protein
VGLDRVGKARPGKEEQEEYEKEGLAVGEAKRGRLRLVLRHEERITATGIERERTYGGWKSL